jgi:hypothetical protein
LANWHRKQDKISIFKRGWKISRYFVDNASFTSALHIPRTTPNTNDLFDHSSLTQRQRKGAANQTNAYDDELMQEGACHILMQVDNLSVLG